MPKKQKFRPRISRVKLNPEQAVLSCSCFSGGWIPVEWSWWPHGGARANICDSGSRTNNLWACGAPHTGDTAYGVLHIVRSVISS